MGGGLAWTSNWSVLCGTICKINKVDPWDARYSCLCTTCVSGHIYTSLPLKWRSRIKLVCLSPKRIFSAPI